MKQLNLFLKDNRYLIYSNSSPEDSYMDFITLCTSKEASDIKKRKVAQDDTLGRDGERSEHVSFLPCLFHCLRH